jgi:UDP-GlcNAc:undecaprenyl-phosphate GlcNAc-1-phosphate transferase
METVYLSVFLSALIITLILTRLCRSLAIRFEIFDQTNSRKIHKEPKPYLGGLAVFFGFFGPLLFVTSSEIIMYLFYGSLLVTSLGLIDDLYGLSGSVKLLGISGAVVLVAPAGLTTNLFSGFPYGIYLNLFVTIVWVLLLVSSINAIDNMDGLAPGLALIASLMFFVIGALQFPQPTWAIVSIGFTGSLLGFLLFNFYPATIFLGDTGSFLIGFVMGMLSLMGNWSTHPLKSIIIPLVILIIPIMDLAFVVFFRYVTGDTDTIRESIEYSAQDHLSHRIQQVRNFGQRRTVVIIYVLGLISGVTGVIMRNTHPLEATLALAAVSLLYFLIILLLLPNLHNIFWRW